MSSDAEHLSLCKDYAYKVNVQIQEISHCVLQIKQQYIFNIFLQFIVLPRFSCSMSAVIKENTKKQIWSLFTRTRNFRTIKAEGSRRRRRRRSFDKGRHFSLLFFFLLYFFCCDLKICPVRVSHCACSDRGFTPGQQSIGILVTLQIHNLH